MADKFRVVQELADEWGKSSPDVLAQIEAKVGEITIDLLSQNECRFAGLRKSTTQTITAGTTVYKLPYDFATIVKQTSVVDADGAFVAEFTFCDEKEFIRRLSLGGYATNRFAMIEYRVDGSDGPGWYMILGGDWDETGYLKIPYYRKPTADDTELIENETILKSGVRSQFPQFNLRAQMDAVEYMRRRSGFRENPDAITTSMQIKPSRRTQAKNRLQHKIGDGL